MMRNATVLLVVALAGCASYRGIEPRAKPVEPAALASEKSLGSEAGGGEWPALDWWKRFGDPQLDALVDEGVSRSPNIRLAAAIYDAPPNAWQEASRRFGVEPFADFPVRQLGCEWPQLALDRADRKSGHHIGWRKSCRSLHLSDYL